MKTDRGNFPAFPGLLRADSSFLARIEQYGPKDLAAFSSPTLGRSVKAALSSWVRCQEIGSKTYYVKTYDYPSLRAKGRGWLRNTAFAETRAEREYRALRWLARAGFPAPRPAAVWLDRTFLGVNRACLVTEAWPGRPVDRLLLELDPGQGRSLLADLRGQIESMHALGFRDRNMDLRNWLARSSGEGRWELAKIDSPRFRLLPPGPARDPLAAEDWSRLRSSLARSGPMASLLDTRLLGPKRPPPA